MYTKAYIVSAFIDGARGGNLAGVVLDADHLNDQQKLVIAREVGLSETAFISKSSVADYKLEFFTPERQIAHCGHATIASFCLLKALGKVGEGDYSKETIDGTRRIWIDGDKVFMEQRSPIYTSLSDKQKKMAYRSIGIDAVNLDDPHSPMIVNTGNSFLILPLPNAQCVARLEPDQTSIRFMSEELDLIGFYAFSMETKGSGRTASARMFAPRYGINEEAATGMAAGPLACYLYDVMGAKSKTILIEQGYLMPNPSPSLITVSLDFKNGAITRLMAGGQAKVMRSDNVQFQPNFKRSLYNQELRPG